MNKYKIFGFPNKPFEQFIIVSGESVDQVFSKYRKLYGYFTAVQPL